MQKHLPLQEGKANTWHLNDSIISAHDINLVIIWSADVQIRPFSVNHARQTIYCDKIETIMIVRFEMESNISLRAIHRLPIPLLKDLSGGALVLSLL